MQAIKNNRTKIIILIGIVIISAIFYQFYGVKTEYFSYAMSIRTPKLIVMLVTAFCIGSASVIFQSIIQNTIVTPCSLGMNSLYILIHTLIVFVLGSTSFLVRNKTLSFTIDLIVMGIASVIIYGYLFKKTKGNVLYILLAGTVMATFFSSVTSTLQRIMDPNEYDTLQNALLASFHKVNSSIIVFSIVLIALIFFLLRKELSLLNVLTLGKNHAINLGINYDRSVRRLLLAVTLLIAIATAMVGPISFLGLIIANLARQLFKTYHHSYLILGSTLIGMVVLLIGQSLIEQVFNFSVNISVFINVGGGIYFLYLLLRNRGNV